ncbi:MAG: Ig-like domain-containing protein, partial [Chitinophagaceae bacterium]|nr:Ig-like domain-containing protein [Chitinophagaceae bacterium]
DSALNVNTHEVNLVFDEYVTLDNPVSNLIISPSLKNTPQITSKLRNVTISFPKDTLLPNTTYAFDFGNSVKDVNEGNIARDLRYVFSTGSHIDNNNYGGKVVLAESGKVDSNMIVMLHRNLDDSAVAKEKPEYYTRVNGNGQFIFHNLPEGVFAVYALTKGTYNNLYTDTSKTFAFLDNPVRIGATTPSDTLYAYQTVKRDAAQQQVAAASPVKLPNADKRLRYTVEFDNGFQDILTNMSLSFPRRLNAPDTAGIVLYDTAFRKLNGYRIRLDSARTRILIAYPWKENTPYRLIIAKEAVSDTLGNTLGKTDTVKFTTRREADYGSIRIRFANIDLQKNPVLQLVQGDKLVESVPLTGPEFSRKLYKPGTYDLRILYDTNRNGVWDPGRFFRGKHQPEIVQNLPRQLIVKANWDNEVTINPPAP